MGKIFKNNKNQVRAGWEILFVMISYMFFSVVISAITGMISVIFIAKNVPIEQIPNTINNFMQANPLGILLTQVMDFIALIIVLTITIKAINKKKFSDFGFASIRKNYKNLLLGLLLGAISMTIIFFILLFTKNIKLEGSLGKPKFSSYTFYGLILFIIVGIKEELLSRGYCITLLNNHMKKPWLSIIISSIIFSAMHFFNPNVKILGLFNIVLVGILFGYMFVKTKNLWMPIGYHITWNYFQGNIFGFPVSGTDPHGIYTIKEVNDNILTGGAFGPEAGIITTIIIITGMIVVYKFSDIKEMPATNYVPLEKL